MYVTAASSECLARWSAYFRGFACHEGAPVGRTLLLLELTATAVGVFGSNRLMVRLSPAGAISGMRDRDLETFFGYVVGVPDRSNPSDLHLVGSLKSVELIAL